MRAEYSGRLFEMATVAISDCQPQDRQGDFNSLVFTTNRTSSEQKEIFLNGYPQNFWRLDFNKKIEN
jgi:hypothetical protein